jgi:hypothetical protein
VKYRTTSIPSFYYCLGPHPFPYNCHVDPDRLCARDLESVTSFIASHIRHDPIVHPLALTFLLRRFAVTGDEELHDALGLALAIALESHRDASTMEGRAQWLTVFVEASAVSADWRLRPALRELVHLLRQEWPGVDSVDESAVSTEACLRAAGFAEAPDLVSSAIDELERIVSAAYRPGFGMSHTTHRLAIPHRGEGGLSDQVRTASALLTAFEMTGRLPYAMLADELIQWVRLRDIDEPGRNDNQSPGNNIESSRPSMLECEAVQVLCRLAALYEDPEYKRAAVMLGDVSYRSDASRLLKVLAERVTRDSATSDGASELRAIAAYGLALMALT